MKPILLPTDFSENAANAIRYGLNIAKITKASVIFFHVNHVPVIAPNTPVGVYDTLIRTEEEQQLESLYRIRDTMFAELGINAEEISAQCIVKLGFAVDEINAVAKEHNAGLIVMGTQGASGLQKVFIGTNAASVIKNSECAVLSIPSTVHYKKIEKIVLATDYHLSKDAKSHAPLLEIALLFNAEVLILNIKRQMEEVPTFDQALEGLKIENVFKSVNHSFHFSESDDVIEGIENFVKHSNADVLAMLPHKKSIFELLFKKSHTEEIAYHANIALLTLPESN
ncbi:MAG: universal stress protein [Bacteroidetes bacterium]|nr:universal stress protein [Bacteroidota bacterium]HET6244749.1 universal stress protein [Bacteroidia bacterium]